MIITGLARLKISMYNTTIGDIELHLSRFTDYALRTLMYLACEPGRAVSVEEVSRAYDISFHHVSKISRALVAARWVESRRGRSGGMQLAVDPETLTVATVIRRMEPNLNLVECFDPATNTCRIRKSCRLSGALERARAAFLGSLDSTTLADLVAEPAGLIDAFPSLRAERSASPETKEV